MGTMGQTGLRAESFSELGHGFGDHVGSTAMWIIGLIRDLGIMGRFPTGETGRLSTFVETKRGTGGGMSETQGTDLRGSGWAGTRGFTAGLGLAAVGVGITTGNSRVCEGPAARAAGLVFARRGRPLSERK